MERLSDAQAKGHPILALIKGSAVNQDGASNGLTAPNGPSQERVIRQALANARLSPKDIDLVEAHGTGTTLGDPIEAGALLATYGQDRETPLKLGSIKSNIGHTQAAAGVAGVIKSVLAMRAGLMPKTLHVDSPSSKVQWDTGKVELLDQASEWKRAGRPRRAGVSSFGISGTNAHLILEEAPERVGDGATGGPVGGAPSKGPEGPLPFVLSAKGKEALRDQGARLGAHLRDNPELGLTDVAYSLATTRSCFECRAVVVAAEREELLGGLDALAQGKEAPGLIQGIAESEQGPVFLFSGQGAQHPRMAAGLLQSSGAFAEHIAACEAALSPHVDWSLQQVLDEEQGRWLDRIDIVQPALFAVMVSLARLWREAGVEPSAVVGHSQGEIAAAHIAGALSLDDAARVIALRAKAMAKIAGQGAMLARLPGPGRARAPPLAIRRSGRGGGDQRPRLAGPLRRAHCPGRAGDGFRARGHPHPGDRRRLRRPLGPDRGPEGGAGAGLRADLTPKRTDPDALHAQRRGDRHRRAGRRLLVSQPAPDSALRARPALPLGAGPALLHRGLPPPGALLRRPGGNRCDARRRGCRTERHPAP